MRRSAITLMIFALAFGAQATEAGWALLREGEQVVLLRHAMAPGATDPVTFDIAKCSTQRNLSERGKQQARKIGALFAARAGTSERVLTSRYCRAKETARLAFGDAEDFPPLEPPASDEAEREKQFRSIVDVVTNYSGSGNLVLVTHLETILALTGQTAREGEAVIVGSDGEKLHVLGRIVFN